MHLRFEIVENGDAIPARHERINEMGADVSSATGHENVGNWHASLTFQEHTEQMHTDIGEAKSSPIFRCVPLVLIGRSPNG
jgi:hypothetical protein